MYKKKGDERMYIEPPNKECEIKDQPSKMKGVKGVAVNLLLHLSSMKSTCKMKSTLIEIVSDGDLSMLKSVKSDEQQMKNI